jgi:WD40 repeat protein
MMLKAGRMHPVELLGVGCLGLLSPLSAQEPKLRATFMGHADSVYCVAFSPDGKTLASGSYDGTIKLWDVAIRDRHDKLVGGRKS